MLVLVPLPPIDTHATAPFRFDLSFAAIVKLRSSAMFTLKRGCATSGSTTGSTLLLLLIISSSPSPAAASTQKADEDAQ